MAKREKLYESPTEESLSVGKGWKPSGDVTTDGKISGANLPPRTSGSNSVPEVTYDHNGGSASRGVYGKE